MPFSSALTTAEDAGWNELHALVDSLTPEEAERPGYYEEGRSASDMLAHIGSWLAAAGAVLERIRAGTYRSEEIDVDAWNERFHRAMKGILFEMPARPLTDFDERSATTPPVMNRYARLIRWQSRS